MPVLWSAVCVVTLDTHPNDADLKLQTIIEGRQTIEDSISECLPLSACISKIESLSRCIV
jgi:hypothetical protein